MNWTIVAIVGIPMAAIAVIVWKYLDMMGREPGLCDNCQRKLDEAP